MASAPLHIYQLVTNPVCSPYRLEIPGKALNDCEGIKVTLLTCFGQAEYKKVIHEADIIILQRLHMEPQTHQVLDGFKQAGKLIVYEIDDDLIHLNPESRYAKQAPKGYGQSIEACIRACHAVQCSTSQLAERIKAFHTEVAVLPNQLDQVAPFIEKSQRGGPVIVGYAAGQDHYLDWLTIGAEYNRTVAEMESGGVKMETWIIGDQEIYESLSTANKRFFPLLSRMDYMQFLRNLNISLCPLADNFFNQAKSDVKYLESAASSSAVLASRVVYGDTVTHGETGALFSNAQEFGQQLRRLVKEPQYASQMAVNAHQSVAATRLIRQHVNEWVEVYRDWFVRRKEIMSNRENVKYN